MTVRLRMKLGLVAESQRPPDSPDTVLVVEPSIGSTTRTKGSLYLVVTGEGGGELRSATNMVAERVRHEYYYDESAGITACLKKAIKAANRELRVTERLVARTGEGGPIGIALAVVRSNELYVATVGPAEAYLVREARLLTLPESGPDSGLPCDDGTEPVVWHGDLLVGDSVILISPNATRRIGLAPIQDAVIQLHPQVAIDQIHRQLAGGGLGVAGGDGMIALEADEVSVTQKTQPLKPVWPSDSLAGVPEHSPIPLAESVSDSVSAVQHTAKQVQRTADGMLRHSVYGLFDRMPRRPVRRVRVTPIAVQRERQRRVASAVVGLLLVLTVVGASLWYLAGTRKELNTDRQGTAQSAYLTALSDENLVSGQGRDLLTSDPQTAVRYLEDAYNNLKIAQANGYTPDQLADLTGKVVGGLNRYYHVDVVTPQVILSFGSDQLTGLVLGPDGGAYVIDQTNDSVYRIDLVTRAKLQVAVKGEQPVGGGIVGSPRLLAEGGLDVLILDSANTLWRYRPPAGVANAQGTLIKINVEDSGTWGTGVRAIGTFLTDATLAQYALYVVVPSAGQVVKYPPSSDGSGYYAKAKTNYLNCQTCSVAQVDDMYIDGSVYLLDNGVPERFDVGQQIRGWTADPVGDTVMRPTPPFFTRITSDNPIADQGDLYLYDPGNRRVVSYTKSNGTYVQEFVLPSNSPWFSALKGMFVRTGPNGSDPQLFWIEGGNLLAVPLTNPALASPSPGLSPGLSPGVSPSHSPGASLPKASPTK
jgi:hypothetical protein